MARGQRADSGTKNFPAQRNSVISHPVQSAVQLPALTHTHTPLPSSPSKAGPNWQEKSPLPNSSPDTNNHTHTHTQKTKRHPETHTPTRNHPNQKHPGACTHGVHQTAPAPRSERAGVDTNTQILMLTANIQGTLRYVYTYVISNPVSQGCYAYFKDRETET